MPCNHLDPTTWTHRAGSAWCPGCGRWMGRVADGTARRPSPRLKRGNEPASEPAESEDQ